jgi:hypothetical protein
MLPPERKVKGPAYRAPPKTNFEEFDYLGGKMGGTMN